MRPYGGFGGAAKFLLPNALSLLLDHGLRTRDNHMLENVYRTLGFTWQQAVCATNWAVRSIATPLIASGRFPHFEIMLDDNALMARPVI